MGVKRVGFEETFKYLKNAGFLCFTAETTREI